MSDQKIHAPELPAGLTWFNTEPLTIYEQRGKVTLLHFWSYCCINCMHVLHDLKILEEKYGDRLAIISVHSPKFPQERIDGQVQKAINRFHIRHPVVNDPGMTLWQQYSIKAWPSVIFIDAEGYVIGVLRGEGKRQQLDELIGQYLKKAEKKGIAKEEHISISMQREEHRNLLFPGKVHAAGHYLYLADSGHNRVLEAYPSGKVRRVFGSTSAGYVDGQGTYAAFRNPQGMASLGEYVFVADTDNHCVRRINLTSEEVETIAGNGKQGYNYEGRWNDPLSVSLNSPWDLEIINGVLFIAMAGQHQVWQLDLKNNVLSTYAGIGREGVDDAWHDKGTLAQPQGLTHNGDTLYFADAEGSTLRKIELETPYITTLINGGLFEFGDIAGPLETARLQHPMGICFDSMHNCLYVADTYNSKIRKVDLNNKEVLDLDVGLPLDEPAGLCLHEGSLYIANTNAHEIVCMDLASGMSLVLDIDETTDDSFF